MLLEIACFSLESCHNAQFAGADRIEFCRNYEEGGLTPAPDDILKLKFESKIPIHVIIRPRPGNFVYDSSELKQMKRDISYCRNNGIDGVVFGILKTNGKVDEEACKELLRAANPMSCTFHRAIDDCADIFESVEALITLGFDSVLSSGGKTKAPEGKEVLKKLQDRFGRKINIIAGGALRSENIKDIFETSGCRHFHSSALIDGENAANISEIRKMKNILNGLEN